MNDDETPEHDGLSIDRRTAMKGGLAGLGLLTLGGLSTGTAAADHQPADKMAVAGNIFQNLTLDTSAAGNAEYTSSTTQTLLSGTLKTSSPTDLIINASVESALWTDIKVKGNDEDSQAKAGLKCWVMLDGEPVAVFGGYDDLALSAADASKVMFNYRDFRMQTNFLQALEDAEVVDEEAYIQTWLNTRSSNAFNWITLNVGSGVHTVELKGELSVMVDDDKAHAAAAVGPCTLVVNPVKLSNDAEI